MKKSVRYILNGLSLPVFVVNPSGEISFMNKAAQDRYTTAKGGQRFDTVITSRTCLKALKKVLKGAPNDVVNVTLQEVVPTAFRVSLSRLDSDRTVKPSCVLSFEDISHIQEAEQMRHDFVANVSHELRSPLTAISGFIETLQGPAKGDDVAHHRFLGLMAKESERMARLIADLLSLSKLQSSERIAPISSTDLCDVLRRVQSTLSGLAEKQQITLDIAFPTKAKMVLGDSDELTQVFQNLIENALKYSATGSKVSVSFDKDKKNENYSCVHIKDQGDGIDAAQIPRLTERFYRVDKGRSRAHGGTGLGLAIVKHILIRHRGRLKIKSEVGKGSVFTVYLRVAVD